MAKTHTYSMKKVLAAREVLRQLPAREKEKSRAEVVDFLKADLRKAVKQGHSLKEIQAVLAEQSVSVSLSHMEAVLGQSGKDSARKRTDMPKALKSNTEADAPKNEPMKSEMQETIPTRKTESEKMPSYYTPDLSDTKL